MTKKRISERTVFSGHREDPNVLAMFDVLCKNHGISSRNKGINRLIRDAIVRGYIPEWNRAQDNPVLHLNPHKEHGSSSGTPKSYSLDSSSKTKAYRL